MDLRLRRCLISWNRKVGHGLNASKVSYYASPFQVRKMRGSFFIFLAFVIELQPSGYEADSELPLDIQVMRHKTSLVL